MKTAGADSARGTTEGEQSGPSGRSLAGALGLTLASALFWGVAHLVTGRRISAIVLAVSYVALIVTGIVFAVWHSQDLTVMAVQTKYLTGFIVGSLALALVWVAVVLRSYQITRPGGLAAPKQAAGGFLVVVMCAVICAPLLKVASISNATRDTVSGIFQSGAKNGTPVDTADPWKGRRRVNIALLASDNASDRVGTRTDSMTVASIDTETGDATLLGLPRNLEHFPMPAGPPRQAFPDGFTGDGPQNPGLLNEVFDYATNHPEIMPGVPQKQRGPELVTKTISGIIDQPIDYYILVDMFGFADIIDAMGGVKIKIVNPIPYGTNGDVLQPGDRVLTGKQALWYGRSRNDSDDYTRMGRQKCLLRAVARQANPEKVLAKFEKLAGATKRAIATNIPQELLPAFVKLAEKAHDSAKISSLMFVPPLISTSHPDIATIRKLSAQAIGEQPSPSPSAAATQATGPTTPPIGTGSPSPSSSPTRSGPDYSTDTSGSQTTATKPVSLDSTCPS
jgi:LCP family protein required for cell wall assembly